jgi:DNA-binding CsgD family transcriptional regulator
VDREPQDALIDTVYRAVLEPEAWGDVMAQMQSAFRSSAQSLYFLDLEPRRIRPVALSGVGQQWVDAFDALYFAPDNPWIRLTRHLHRPGVVRTNERLAQFVRDDRALYRSQYFNDWMQPQQFKYTLGSTLLADHGVVANVTLLRPRDGPTFDDGEIAAFERLNVHMTRAMRLAVQLEQADVAAAGLSAFDALAHAIAIVDARARLLHANPSMERVLRKGTALAMHGGRLVGTSAAHQRTLSALIADALAPGGDPRHAAAVLQQGPVVHTVQAARLSSSSRRYLPSTPAVLLTVAEPAARMSIAAVRRALACTPAEAALVVRLVERQSLREAAASQGITYETARTYLKVIFGKAGVHSQGQLIAKVLGACGRR